MRQETGMIVFGYELEDKFDHLQFSGRPLSTPSGRVQMQRNAYFMPHAGPAAA